ncbi:MULTISPECIES: hydroxymethylglutaryl-CoA reductase, degradative [Streptococcus]|uniref:hydroxymethylglutaryl-CoA reductase, degradative n=1 Tax=Streptococcus TaxID=1301 RepID=UPI0012DC5F5C|nr:MULTISPECIES: hydroxymethylglutaryl-CoA reductase, degradative [Streptococcus]QHF54280.1 hydroxymethylglutaryl-CoA reductase, degradative [Streptococcus sp. DAT741]
MSHFSGFYKKTRQERIDLLHSYRPFSGKSLDCLTNDTNLSEQIAGKMTENHLGTFSLPFSVLPELVVDGHSYIVPMVTEEPSVVAAASLGAKMIARSGGCSTYIHNRIMIGQVALFDVSDHGQAKKAILEQKATILETANQAHPSIVQRGGGACELTIESKDEFLIVYLQVDVQEAMGANILNTMLEAIKNDLEKLSQGQALMGILSNYATESLITAECHIAISSLANNPAIAQETAKKIALASKLAQLDPYRAATHNKGIFNGIDAVVIATGNDWRAMEAGAHAYACRDGLYRGLSIWRIEGESLIGSITLPLPIASVGGSIGLNPKVAVAFELLEQPKARQLAAIIASVGLCQNFAALRALVTSGIQAGHMKLHAKSLALLAGAEDHEVDTLAQLLRKEKHSNLETAQRLLVKLRTN